MPILQKGRQNYQNGKLVERKETYHWRRKKRPLEERTRYIAYLPQQGDPENHGAHAPEYR
jgi:hypothetical protein